MSEKRILLITGREAEDIVKKYSKQSSIKTEIETLPIEIASFMNFHILQKQLKEKNLEKFSMILVPGQAEFDMQKAEENLGVKVYKGPKHAADIPILLDNIESIQLSKEVPASELLEEEATKRAKEQLKKIEEENSEKELGDYNFMIGSGERALPVGPNFPLRIVAEITDAPNLSNNQIIEQTRSYLEQGAEIIDIGMTTQSEKSEEIPRIVSQLRKNFDVPLSVDSTNRSEIETAIEEGIDMVVSIDGSTIEQFSGLDIPAVIIPRDSETGRVSKNPGERINHLWNLVERAKELGYERPVPDPILEPVNCGFSDSLSVFYKIRSEDTKIPLFMGVGNAIELFDADSIGMSALLVGMASEIGVNFVLSVEASDKTRGNVSELVQARDMMLLAERRNSVPKNLGLDLLRIKEKRLRFDPYNEDVEKHSEVIEASPSKDDSREVGEYFKIYVAQSKIIAVFHSAKKPNIVIKGESAEDICREILDRDLVDEPSHAAYLGREIQKAETALRTGRGYVQEEKMFSQ